MNPGEDKRSKLATGVYEALKTVVGSENISDGIDGRSKADVIVKPGSAEEVSSIISIGRKNGTKVYSCNNPSWNTDGTPAAGGILVDLSRINFAPKIDTVSQSVRVGAGTRWNKLIEAVEKEGFTLGSYPFDRSSSVGSWTVTNGVGFGAYKYGSSKDNVLSLRVVTEDAAVIETGYDKIGSYMSGYNLNQLFSASEGTLGIVVEATLKIHPAGINRLAAYEFPSLDAIQTAIKKVVQHPSVK
ncbi:MAG: FAD-binding oxidoreductase, partial [Candidatus Methanoplasma sp.]|nr:FAD-binding oxidoreductase [Candidatus Methanoplasma sp.]